MKVLVINQHGRPLMPTTPRKARILLKEGRAKIVARDPFTIQLLYGTRGYTQPITLGIDAGYKTIGYSAVTEKEELVGGEMKLLEDVSERVTERQKYRRTRRNPSGSRVAYGGKPAFSTRLTAYATALPDSITGGRRKEGYLHRFNTSWMLTSNS